ncbi:MAG: apolipoprotein N-acyltransferase [Bacteroidales bacterium]|nr:apolipoprotein N-acyltransferase [Bacteroidales bacterium]
MMNKGKALILTLLSLLLLSLPWLLPGCGLLSLIAFVPLLCLDYIVDGCAYKRFFWWYFALFALWNAVTTFWVANATLGGAVFAILYNALQMSLVWAVFRLSKKKFRGVLPYIFLAVMWIAWERRYFFVDISWPWLTLGNAFAQSTRLVQWYELTGCLGGSLWIWACNLGIFGLVISLASLRWKSFNTKGRAAFLCSLALLLLAPIVASEIRYASYKEDSCGKLDVVVAQPNIDPYHKYGAMPQAQQNEALLQIFSSAPDSGVWQGDTPEDKIHLVAGALVERQKNAPEFQKDSSSLSSIDSIAAGSRPRLYIAPESFTSDIFLNDPRSSATVRTFAQWLSSRPGSEILFGASTYEFFYQNKRPSALARNNAPGQWYENRNSAILVDGSADVQIYHKSKLVVGTELTPLPALFVPLDDALGGVMGRCIPQKEVSVLNVQDSIPVGSVVCYESIYGEYCTGYVSKGAQLLCVITNDAWWGDTPGYRQHLSYSRLRAIETRRDIARSANTGISAIINQRGDIVEKTSWWTPASISTEVNLSKKITPYVQYGDIVGKLCSFVFLLLAAWLLVSLVIRKD